MLTDDDVVRDRRLLCAANLTYDIMHAHERSDCRTDRDNFDLQMSGLHTYQGFISGFEFADAGLIGVTDFEILLAFRGTQPLNLSTKHDLVESISDWIHQFQLFESTYFFTIGRQAWLRFSGRLSSRLQ